MPLSDVYYQGMKTFWEHTDQFTKVQQLVEVFFKHFKQGVERTMRTPAITQELAGQLNSLVTQPLCWLDLGSGNGEATAKIFASFDKIGLPAPHYEGVEPDEVFVRMSNERFSSNPDVRIRMGSAFDRSLTNSYGAGQFNCVSALHSLYFEKDLKQFKEELNTILAPTGIAFFVHSGNTTNNRLKPEFGAWTITTQTATFFPPISEAAWDLLTGHPSPEAISNFVKDLGQQEQKDFHVVKEIIEAMSEGEALDSDRGHQQATDYRKRISGEDFGGKGQHVVDNALLVYVHPQANAVLKFIAQEAYQKTKREIEPQIEK